MRTRVLGAVCPWIRKAIFMEAAFVIGKGCGGKTTDLHSLALMKASGRRIASRMNHDSNADRTADILPPDSS